MNPKVEGERWLGEPPTGRALSDAIDVVAWLTEQSDRIAGNGEDELAMSKALSATFEYMVAYVHHLTTGQREPRDALARAAAGMPELEITEIDLLQALSRSVGPKT